MSPKTATIVAALSTALWAGCGDGPDDGAFRSYTFTTTGWVTIEHFWFAGTGDYPERRICVEPSHPLRLRVAGHDMSSADRCLNYGGRTAGLWHEVQAKGAAGDQMQIVQSLPPDGATARAASVSTPH